MWSLKKQNKELKLKPPSFRSIKKEIFNCKSQVISKQPKFLFGKIKGKGRKSVVKTNVEESRKFSSDI